jgi:DNA-binding NtrC family response regulator
VVLVHPRRATRIVRVTHGRTIISRVATETLDESSEESAAAHSNASPGLVVVYAAERPRCLVLPLVGGALDVGRRELADLGIRDSRASLRHARVELTERGFRVRDLGSKNGTSVEGHAAAGTPDLASPLVRIGRALLLAVGDCRPFRSPGVVAHEQLVVGPRLAAAHRRIVQVAEAGEGVLISGGSGAGKELAAGLFHAATRRGGPLIAVNCATIQRELTERILFGVKRGAYTGATHDAPGLFQAAHGGTLFLDEIAEVDPAVQAKLLRVLETKTVTPLGAVAAVAADVRLCAATHKDLREEVLAGRLREDLYFRIGRPEVRLPPLRERREEIPWLIAQCLASHGDAEPFGAHTDFVEACMVRPWPGNVRELLAETRAALRAAASSGRRTLHPRDLDGRAGLALERAIQPSLVGSPAPERVVQPPRPERTPDAAEIESVLLLEQGNVVRAAARLGITRGRARRLIERHGIDLDAVRARGGGA